MNLKSIVVLLAAAGLANAKVDASDLRDELVKEIKGLKEEFGKKFQENDEEMAKLQLQNFVLQKENEEMKNSIFQLQHHNRAFQVDCDCDLLLTEIADLKERVQQLDEDGIDFQITFGQHLRLIEHAEEDIKLLNMEVLTSNANIGELKIRSRKSAICGYNRMWMSEGTIKFDGGGAAVHQEVEEVGSVLDGATGVYTAGADGTYEVSLSGVCGVDSAEEVYISLVGAGTESEDEFFIDSYSNAITLQDQCAATRQVTLKEGQQLHIDFNIKSGSPMIGQVKFCVTLY